MNFSFRNFSIIRKNNLLLISIIFFYLVLCSYFINRGLNYIDEGYILQGVQRIFNNQKPYNDFDTQVTPGSFYLVYLLMKIFGKQIIIGRIWVMLEGIFIIVLLFFLGKIYLPTSYFFIPSFLYIFWGPIHHPLPFYSYDTLVFSILSFLLLSKSFIGKNRIRYLYLFLGGFFSFVSFIFKQNTGIATLLIGTIITFLHCLDKKLKFYPFLYFGGAILSMLLFLSFLIYQNILPNFINTIFIIPFRAIFFKNSTISYVGINKFPFPGGKGKIIWTFIFFIWVIIYYCKKDVYEKIFKINKNFLFYFILIVGIVIVLFQIIKEEQTTLLFRTINSFTKSFLTIFPIIFLFFSFLFSKNSLSKNTQWLWLYLLIYNLIYIPMGLLMGEDFIHFLYILPMALIIFTKVLTEIEKKFKNLILGLICVWGIINALQNTSQNFVFSQIYKQNEFLETKFSKKIKVENSIKKDYEFIVNYIEQNTYSDEYVFVWGTDPILNFLCDKMSPSKYILFLFTTPTFEEDTIKSLKSKNVRYIIMRKNNIYNPFFKELKKFDKINNFIQNNYKIIYDLEYLSILKKI